MSFTHFTESGFETNCEAGFANLQKDCPCGYKYLAVRVEPGVSSALMGSINGTSWEDSGGVIPITNIISNNDIWIMGSEDEIHISNDGKSWDIYSSPIQHPRLISWNGSYFIMIGYDVPFEYPYPTYMKSAVSEDGINWTLKSNVNLTEARTLKWGDDQWYIYGNNISPIINYTAISADANSWSMIENTTHDYKHSAYNGYLWGAVGYESYYPFTSTARYSVNGVDWTQPYPPGPPYPDFTPTYGHDIIWDGNQFMAVGFTSFGSPAILPRPFIMYSVDGVTWSGSYTDSTDYTLQSIAYNGNSYVTGGNELLKYSTDGIHWSNINALNSRWSRITAKMSLV